MSGGRFWTNLVHVLELAAILPAMIIAGILPRRRHPLRLRFAVPLLVMATVGYSSTTSLAASGRAIRETPAEGARRTAPLYVVPTDSLFTLVPGTPVEIVLRSGGKVLGNSLLSRPDADPVFLVRAFARELYGRRDTVQIPVAGIELAVSTVRTVVGSQPYAGPLKLSPLPSSGEDPVSHMKPVIVVLTIVTALAGLALVGAVAAH